MTESRNHLRISTFDHVDILKYLSKKKDTVVVHGINECDERKGARGINKFLMRANLCTEYTVFIGTWLADLYAKKGFSRKNYAVILNGTNSQIFQQKWK